MTRKSDKTQLYKIDKQVKYNFAVGFIDNVTIRCGIRDYIINLTTDDKVSYFIQMNELIEMYGRTDGLNPYKIERLTYLLEDIISIGECELFENIDETIMVSAEHPQKQYYVFYKRLNCDFAYNLHKERMSKMEEENTYTSTMLKRDTINSMLADVGNAVQTTDCLERLTLIVRFKSYYRGFLDGLDTHIFEGNDYVELVEEYSRLSKVMDEEQIIAESKLYYME